MSAQPTPVSNPPTPLTLEEARKLWASERWMVRLAAMAIMMLAAAMGMAQLYGEVPVARALVLTIALLLMLAVIVIHLRERCPRCGARLASAVSLLLPHNCPRCGVEFPRPLDVDSEIDN